MELAVDNNEDQIYDLSERSKRKKFVKPVVNEAFSENVYKKIMYDYNNGTPEEREQAQCDMLKFLNNFMYATLMKNFAKFMGVEGSSNMREDVIQEAITGILIGMKNYDPERTRPSTYFQKQIIGRVQKFITNGTTGITAHYSAILQQINKIEREYQLRGETCSLVELEQKTGESAISIQRALDQKKLDSEKLYLDALENADNLISEYAQTPEELVIEDSTKDEIIKCIQTCLTEEEKECILLQYYSEDEELGYTELGCKLGGLSGADAKKLSTRARDKMRRYFKRHNIFTDRLKLNTMDSYKTQFSFVDVDEANRELDMYETCEVIDDEV